MTRRNPAMVKGRKRSRNTLEQDERCELPRLRLRPDLQAPQSVPDLLYAQCRSMELDVKETISNLHIVKPYPEVTIASNSLSVDVATVSIFL